MKRLSLLGFGLLASMLAGCPIFSGDGGQGGSQICTYNCSGGCQQPSDCPSGETCGPEGQCYSGDCTEGGCPSGYMCQITPIGQSGVGMATCVSDNTGAGGGATISSGNGSTGTAGNGGTSTAGNGGTSTAGNGGTSTAGTGGTGGKSSGTGATSTGAGGSDAGPTDGGPICSPDGQQGGCSDGSICLNHVCWISCANEAGAPDQSICAGNPPDFATCTTLDADSRDWLICGEAPDGG